MWKVTWNVHWGTRFQTDFVSLYYSRKPTNKEILRTFRAKGHMVSENFHEPRCSGMIRVNKIETEF